MVTVSVSVYNDAGVLDGCLRSVRETLPDARIQVVDGRYATWPAEADNSTDETPEIADAFDAEYHPAGPFYREREKHVHREAIAPDNEACLLLDADERLHEYDGDALDAGVAYEPRIVNARVYHDHTPIVYWPRILPAGPRHYVEEIRRWNDYAFGVPCRETDAVTIIHRHDLRDREYREAKYERFENEGRTGRYEQAGRADAYYANTLPVETVPCPECGHDSVTVTPMQFTDGVFSQVRVCVRADGCYTESVRTDVDAWDYLPDDLGRGFEEDPAQLREELIDVGYAFARELTPEQIAGEFQPTIRIWAATHFPDD